MRWPAVDVEWVRCESVLAMQGWEHDAYWDSDPDDPEVPIQRTWVKKHPSGPTVFVELEGDLNGPDVLRVEASEGVDFEALKRGEDGGELSYEGCVEVFIEDAEDTFVLLSTRLPKLVERAVRGCIAMRDGA